MFVIAHVVIASGAKQSTDAQLRDYGLLRRFAPRNDERNSHERRQSVKDNDNLTIERPTFVTHLECAMEGDHYPADQIHNLSKAGKPLLVRYDLAGVKKALTKDALAQRPADMWRYRELLPVRKCSRHRQPRRGHDAADPAAEARRRSSAAARSSSRTRAGCRPARSRRAAS